MKSCMGCRRCRVTETPAYQPWSFQVQRQGWRVGGGAWLFKPPNTRGLQKHQVPLISTPVTGARSCLNPDHVLDSSSFFTGEFLNLSTTDIFRVIILCCCRMFSSIPDPYALDASSITPSSCHNHRCLQTFQNIPWGAKVLQVENSCSTEILETCLHWPCSVLDPAERDCGF